MNNLFDRFSAQVAANGGWVERVSAHADAVILLGEKCRSDRESVLVSDRLYAMHESYRTIGRAMQSVPYILMKEVLSNATAGITSCDGLIAETGTVVLLSTPGEPRMLSLLPEQHIVVAPANRFTRTLEEYLGEGSSAAFSGNRGSITLVSGPSRTSDIEKTLIMGVHGPRDFGVIVIGGSDG
jgi:L-lactate dehydrogenase complex protein LldG